MPTLWETVTGNSTLPVQAGNTFWDHINNQAGGGGQTIGVFVTADVNYSSEIDTAYPGIEADVSGTVSTDYQIQNVELDLNTTGLEVDL